MKLLSIKLALIGTVVFGCASTVAAEEDRRLYEDGPLTKDDFRGEPPSSTGKMAYTATELRYEYRWRYTTRGRDVTAALSGIDIHAYIRRDLSGNRRPDDKDLLDHEQGHADNAQIQCLRARLAFGAKARGGAQLRATAPTVAEANAALGRQVAGVMREFDKAVVDADADYDRETSYGVDGKQAEWRRVHVESIKRLVAECEKQGAFQAIKR